jgi:deoxyribonuclease (pyrimidine dimer)
MTRISSGISGRSLTDVHLRKERIEILRIPNTIKNGKAKVDLKKIPKDFRLGNLHVVYFYNKLKYIHKRYNELTEECIKRGFNVTDYSDAFKDLPEHLYNDWDDNIPRVKEIVRERITERLLGMRQVDLKYYGKPITVEELILKMQ